MSVYFIANRRANAVKIGLTVDIWKRLDMLQIGTPDRLVLIGLIDTSHANCNDRVVERRWHERWASHRVKGEWFRIAPDLLWAIGDEVSKHGLPLTPRSDRFWTFAGMDQRIWAFARQVFAERARRFLDDRYCPQEAWYGCTEGGHGFKGRLSKLVGWERPGNDERLQTVEAYDTCYQTLYESLPDCRGCDCYSFEQLKGLLR